MAEPTEEQVRRIAQLARLRLEPGDVERFQEDLGRILAAFSALAAIDVSGIEPTSHVLDLKGGGRDDAPRLGLPRERALESAPDAAEGHFRTPRVIG